MSIVGICMLLFIIRSSSVQGVPKVPCHFVFGDSLFDVGNNNNLNTVAKANYSPYGVDYPGGVPTGRFTNGLTVPDILNKLLGYDGLTKPFTTATAQDSLKGVNYASASGGILQESGAHLVDQMWFGKQVLNHAITVARLQSIIKGPVSDYLKKCLYTINIGTNDYINNYFMPQNYPSNGVLSQVQFANKLVAEYRKQLQVLSSSGASKMAIFGIGKLGCTPAEIQKNKATQCVHGINQAVMFFNQQLKSLVDDLNSNSSNNVRIHDDWFYKG